MKNRDVISGLFLALLSAGTCLMAYRLGLGTGKQPGPGLVAFGIAALLGLMSLYLMLEGVLQAKRGRNPPQQCSSTGTPSPSTHSTSSAR